MKHFLTIGLLLLGISSSAQITLDTTYSQGINIIKLEKSGYKYITWSYSTDSIYLYNLDHSPFKAFPMLTTNPGGYVLAYITEALFDTDSNTIEYALENYNNTPPSASVKIISETGNIIFQEFNARFTGSAMPQDAYNTNIRPTPVVNTPTGTKMRLSLYTSNLSTYLGTNVYSLPGQLECEICYNEESVTSVNIIENSPEAFTGYLSEPVPNPGYSTVSIEFTLPEGVRLADLVFYNQNGQNIKSVKVNHGSSKVNISVKDLAAGSYYYKLITTSGISEGKKMVVIR